MPALPDLPTVAAAVFVVTVAPGPATLAAATVAMCAGRGNGLRFGAGLAAGLAVRGVLAATGPGALLQGSAHAVAGSGSVARRWIEGLTAGLFAAAGFGLLRWRAGGRGGARRLRRQRRPGILFFF